MKFLDGGKALDTVVKNGKYGVITIGIYLIYKLIDKAIEKDYSISLDLKSQKLELNK